MATMTQETRFDLAKRELISLADARDHVLSCSAGELWITQEGDARDIVIRPGDSWRIDTNTEVVISALQPSTLSLQHCQALGSLADGARRMLWSLRHWEFPPLAAFPARLIR